jgi:hypothetical protein
MPNAASRETSVELNRPLEIFEFQNGNDFYRLTSSEVAVEFGGSTYTPAAMDRGNIGRSGEAEQTTLEVRLPTTSTLASLYLGIQPANRTTLTLRRVHQLMSPSTAITLFRGFVTSARFNDEQATLLLKPFNELFQREMPRYTYQGLCNHILYGNACGIIETDPPNQLTAQVTAFVETDGSVVTVTGAGAVADNKSPQQAFKGGFARLTDFSDYRLILDQDGDTITLLLPFRTNILGSDIVLQRGCDKTVQTCLDKFNNVPNYGGFPHVPAVNPFNQGTFVEPSTDSEPASVDLGKYSSFGGRF